MSDFSSNYVPPVGFYFSVGILEAGATEEIAAEGSFLEVSGISVSLEKKEIREGGENRFTHRVPTRTKYENLVLKRGLVLAGSELANWCKATFYGGLENRVETRTIQVALVDVNSEAETGPLMIWVLENASPIKWSVNDLNAQKSEIVVEELSFAYTHFRQTKEASL